MGFDIVRLVVTSWPDAIRVMKQRGVDFYWLERDERDEPILPSFAFEYEGALAKCPASREFDARDWYDLLRPHLGVNERRICDAHFGALLWTDETNNRTDVLSAAGISSRDIWNALSAEHVREQIEISSRVPWDALEDAFLLGASLIGARWLLPIVVEVCVYRALTPASRVAIRPSSDEKFSFIFDEDSVSPALNVFGTAA